MRITLSVQGLWRIVYIPYMGPVTCFFVRCVYIRVDKEVKVFPFFTLFLRAMYAFRIYINTLIYQVATA